MGFYLNKVILTVCNLIKIYYSSRLKIGDSSDVENAVSEVKETSDEAPPPKRGRGRPKKGDPKPPKAPTKKRPCGIGPPLWFKGSGPYGRGASRKETVEEQWERFYEIQKNKKVEV